MIFNEKFLKITQLKEYSLYKKDLNYTKDELIKLYEEHYLFNLKTILFDDHFYFKFYSINELIPIESKANLSFTSMVKDAYLRDMKDETLLARDIMQIGTYWPCRTYKDINGNTIVEKGAHRVISAKKLQEKGEWNDRKFLCIETKDILEVPFNNFYTRELLLKQPIRMRIPLTALFPDYKKDDEFIYNMLKTINGVIIDDLVVELDVYNYRDYVRLINYMPDWLRDPFYSYKIKNGEFIKPLDVLNNEESFNDWKTKNGGMSYVF